MTTTLNTRVNKRISEARLRLNELKMRVIDGGEAPKGCRTCKFGDATVKCGYRYSAQLSGITCRGWSGKVSPDG